MKELKVNSILKQKKELMLKLQGDFCTTPVDTLWSITEIESKNRYWLKELNTSVLKEDYGIIVDKQYIEDNFELA